MYAIIKNEVTAAIQDDADMSKNRTINIPIQARTMPTSKAVGMVVCVFFLFKKKERRMYAILSLLFYVLAIVLILTLIYQVTPSVQAWVETNCPGFVPIGAHHFLTDASYKLPLDLRVEKFGTTRVGTPFQDGPSSLKGCHWHNGKLVCDTD